MSYLVTQDTPERKAARKHYRKYKERYAAYSRKVRGVPEPLYPMPAVCECCGSPPGKQAMNVDHCHITGKFRGWLCGKCNKAIGALGDTVVGLHKAVDYLNRASHLHSLVI